MKKVLWMAFLVVILMLSGCAPAAVRLKNQQRQEADRQLPQMKQEQAAKINDITNEVSSPEPSLRQIKKAQLFAVATAQNRDYENCSGMAFLGTVATAGLAPLAMLGYMEGDSPASVPKDVDIDTYKAFYAQETRQDKMQATYRGMFFGYLTLIGAGIGIMAAQ